MSSRLEEEERVKDQIFLFGLSRAVPEGAAAAWGARWIYPDDIVWDRTSWFNGKSEAGDRLNAWLNQHLLQARANARAMSRSGALSEIGQETVILYEDEVGKIVGNPQRSHGYIYVAAWLKEASVEVAAG